MKIAVTLVLCLSVFAVSAQPGKIAIGKFLLTAEEDCAIKAQNEKVEFLKGSSSNMPLIDDIEIRIRNDAYKFDRQRYTLRVEPRGFGETGALRDLYTMRLKYHEQKKELLINRLLKDRYLLVIELLHRRSMLKLYKELIVLYEDRINVLKQRTGSLDFDLNDLIKAEDEFTKLKFDNIERERNIKRLKKEINRYLPGESLIEFDTAGFVSIEFISDLAENTEFILDTNNVYLKYDRLTFQLAEKRYNLETAEGRRYISFFQFSYDHGERMEEMERKNDGRDYDLNRAYIMNLGIRIPYINTDRHDINRRKLTYLDDRENYQKLKRVLGERVKKDSEDIRILVSQYRFLEARGNDVNAESSLKRYMQMDGIDPTILLSIKESILENNIKKAKIKFDILRNYIRVIDVTGQLSKKPLRNFLSSNQEVIAK